MRHRKAGRKFGRNTSHRRAMLRNLAGNLVLHERIETTDAKAKELRRVTERLLSQALRLKGELTVDVATLSDSERKLVQSRQVHARRMVARFLPPRLAIQDNETGESTSIDLVKKLFEEIAPRYIDRVMDDGQSGGGYTRIIKLGRRRGDNAPMSLIEFVGYESPLEREPEAAPVEEAAPAEEAADDSDE